MKLTFVLFMIWAYIFSIHIWNAYQDKEIEELKAKVERLERTK